MNAETRNCQNCKNDFQIEPGDFDFYAKIDVPAPTWCVYCRQQRRYAWRNERTLYRRNCDLCQKSTVTIYSPDKPYKVYCLSCWWGDGWDPAEYGKDFDFSRSFFEQFAELQKIAPRMALLTKNSVNSDYANHAGNNKNAYISFAAFDCENVSYCSWIMNSIDCVDCSFVYEKGEKLYECIDVHAAYKSQYSIFMNGSTDCLYCFDVNGSGNCFMSYNLRSQNYVFRNKKYSREEYFKLLAEYDLSSYAVRQELFKEYLEMVKTKAIHKYMQGERNVASEGNLLFSCKNVKNCFELDRAEDCKNIYGSLDIKDSMDLYHVGRKVELCYECHGCTGIYNCHFCHLCYDNSHLDYCDSCQNSQNLFGCVSVKKGEYMILNKKYSKEEYHEMKEKIIKHMRATGEYGEFFPIEIAPVYFNETRAMVYMPLTKDEVLAKGWNWEEKSAGVFGKGTVDMKDVPDSINDVEEAYISNIFTCVSCTKNFNITNEEFHFYKREIVPLPRKCPDCREKDRILQRMERKLYRRSCVCNLPNHDHEGGCKIEFETTYAPDRPEKVYCEKCYQKEVL